jgi:hypothetical protein
LIFHPQLYTRKKDEPQAATRGPQGYWPLARNLGALIVPEEREQKDDGQRNSQQPQQQSTTKAHVYLLSSILNER